MQPPGLEPLSAHDCGQENNIFLRMLVRATGRGFRTFGIKRDAVLGLQDYHGLQVRGSNLWISFNVCNCAAPSDMNSVQNALMTAAHVCLKFDW